MEKKNLIIAFIFLSVIVVVALFLNKRPVEENKEPGITSGLEEKLSSPKVQEEAGIESTNKERLQSPQMEIDKNKKYLAILKSAKGVIKLELFADKTPITVNNFVSLSRKKFYDGTIFHRVIKGFMIQGGDPKGNGTGGPGYQLDDEPFEGEYSRGTVAMANAGPNTNGSQFFIMHQDYDLPKNYVIFGKVTEGMDVVDKIGESETKLSPSGENSIPVEPTIIESIEIVQMS